MQKRMFLFVSLFLLVGLFAGSWAVSRTVAQAADCSLYNSGGITPLSSVDFTLTCTADTTVYFGVCDSGGVPNDDLFTVTYANALQSYNYYVAAIDEYTVLGDDVALAGDNTITMASTNTTPYPPATHSLAISPNAGEVVNYLQLWCGADWKGVGPGVAAGCDTAVPLFTTDAAPANGTLQFHVLFGNEGARADEIVFMSWNVTEGQQINNAYVSGLPAPRYARVWWQPEGSTDWYMLTSQYYAGAKTAADEYGISCQGAQPSYHTSFASAVPESDVCFDFLSGSCK